MKLLKFEAPWCQPCKALTMTLASMDIPYPIEVINIDENRDACLEYGIRGVPHMILMDENNNIVTRIGGAVTSEVIREALNLQ